mmetsp:Transcript_10514/g.16849  ORF Transcript_10514/g.16849 Transcript_10514/m.16849 type:complete len:133 (+) Transcript_10514:1696-2094(+)
MKCVSPDYCDGIPGVGPKKAIKLLRQHGSLESYLKAVFKKTTDQTKRANIAFDPNHLLRVRNLFAHPNVETTSLDRVRWRKKPDEKGLIKFLVEERGFNSKRVQTGIQTLKVTMQKEVQTRLDSYFLQQSSS